MSKNVVKNKYDNAILNITQPRVNLWTYLTKITYYGTNCTKSCIIIIYKCGIF